MLRVHGLDLYYGDAQALAGVTLEVPEGEIVAIVGANGAGKTSLIRTIAGIERARAGRVEFKGRDITRLESHAICNLGVGQVAEGRQIFPTLTVAENLDLGAAATARARRVANRRWTRSTRCFRCSPNARSNSPGHFRAASSRCWRSVAA